MAIDALGERPADSRDLGDVIHRRRLDPAQPAEVLDQGLAALGADARDLVQHGSRASFAASRPMSQDGEAVRLVADLLDEMEPGVGRRKLEAALLRLEDQLLHPRFALRALGHAHDAHLVQTQISQDCGGYAGLAFSAVDQDEIGDFAALLAHALVAPLEDLTHRGVVVARRDAADVEAAVVGLLHLLPVVYDARGHGRLAHGMADVEALDALRTLGQAERLAQRHQAAFLRRPVAHTLGNREQRVLARHAAPPPPLAVRGRNDFRLRQTEFHFLT